MEENVNVDVIVVGGGPSGSTVSTLVAKAGNRVLLLERERFPRHQIGESLLPATIHFICPLLGVEEEIKNAGFPRKLGGVLRWGKSMKPWSFSFGATPALAGPNSYAYQVRRAEFDDILLRNARKSGVDVREQHTVRGLIREDGRVAGVRFTDAEGNERTARARYVVDATGNTTHLSSQVGERVYSKFFRNVALYAYYEGGGRLPSPHEGSIYVAAFDEGWFWYIPLSDTLTSVGAVVDRKYADLLRDDPERAMRTFMDKCPSLRELLGEGKRVTEGIYGQYRVRKDWSYCNTSFWGKGAVLVGDAACFIDPVFSSGVHLATYGALLAARSINTCLAGELDEARAFEEFELRYRREYGNFYQFLVAFYDMHQDEGSYFWKARDVLKSDESTNEAFVRLVSGVSTTREPVFRSANEIFEAESVWKSQDKYIEQWRATPKEQRRKEDLDKMIAEVSDRVAEVLYPPEARARTLDVFHSGPEAARQLFAGGLVPTDDELRWREP
jgi:halogenation protein CepH